MVESDYAVVRGGDAPTVDMADVEAVPEEYDALTVHNLDGALGTEEMKVKLWEVPPGASMGAHAHEVQEECYYVLDGEFALYVGPDGEREAHGDDENETPGDGEKETHEVGPGTTFAASPGVVRGYENVGDDLGRMLVVAAPNAEEGEIPEDEWRGD